MKKKIYIIGRGINPSKHLNLYAIEKLKISDKIVGIENDKEFWNKFSKENKTVEIESVSHLYLNLEKDKNNYERFIDYIISLTNHYDNISLLILGHPLFGVTFIEGLKSKLSKEIDIEIIEGISSFDSMITMLNVDPLEQGTVLLDANRLLLFRYKLQKYLSYFIYHVSSIGTSKINYINPDQDNKISILQKYLLQFYAPNKEILLCQASSMKSESPVLISTTLEFLCENLSKIDYKTTMYLKAENPENIDWDYLKLLKE